MLYASKCSETKGLGETVTHDVKERSLEKWFE